MQGGSDHRPGGLPGFGPGLAGALHPAAGPPPADTPGVPGVHQPGWWSACPPAARDLRFDTSVPHPARVYGYWIGSKDNYEADRKAAEEVIRLRPQVVASARANRAFLCRVVRYLAA